MTTNPVLTLSPIAIRRRTLVRILNRRRAELMAAYAKHQAGTVSDATLIAALGQLYEVSVQLDGLDELDLAQGN